MEETEALALDDNGFEYREKSTLFYHFRLLGLPGLQSKKKTRYFITAKHSASKNLIETSIEEIQTRKIVSA